MLESATTYSLLVWVEMRDEYEYTRHGGKTCSKPATCAKKATRYTNY